MTAFTRLATIGAALALTAGAVTASRWRAGARADIGERGLLVSGYRLLKDPKVDFLSPTLARLGGNTLVVRIKDSDGLVLTPTAVPARHGLAMPAPVLPDFADVARALATRGRRVVAYLVVFKDRAFGDAFPKEAIHVADGRPFADPYGVFIDPASPRYQAYVLDLVDELAALPSVDEVMLDYVRFPEYDANHTNLSYPYTRTKAERTGVIEEFVARAAERVHRRHKRLSISVFPPSRSDYFGLDLGQDLARLATEVDVLSPMIYPDQFLTEAGDTEWQRFFSDSFTRAQGFARAGGAELRPWIQGFAFDRSSGKRVAVALPDARMSWQMQYLSDRRVPFLIYHSRSEYRLP